MLLENHINRHSTYHDDSNRILHKDHMLVILVLHMGMSTVFFFNGLSSCQNSGASR